MSQPLKKSGFSQGLYQISSTAKEEVGTLRFDKLGNKYRYAKAGASALSAGKMGQAAAIAANVTSQACPAAAVGAKVITLTAGGAVTYAADYFKGGQLQIDDTGARYEIESSTAVAAGTSITVTLKEGIKTALTTSQEFTLVHSPWMATIEAAVEENRAVGVPLVAVTAAYYYWAQTGGLGLCLTVGTPAKGTGLILSATVAGALDAQVTALDIDEPVVAEAYGTAGRSGEYCPVWLQVER